MKLIDKLDIFGKRLENQGYSINSTTLIITGNLLSFVTHYRLVIDCLKRYRKNE